MSWLRLQVQGHVDDAVAKGATVTIGGKRPDLPQPHDKVRRSMLAVAALTCCAWPPTRQRQQPPRADDCYRVFAPCCLLVSGSKQIQAKQRIPTCAPSAQGFFFLPTVLANATIEMKVFREETFGPAIPLLRFRDDSEAVQLANDTEYGLAAYFWTQARGAARHGRTAGILGSCAQFWTQARRVACHGGTAGVQGPVPSSGRRRAGPHATVALLGF